MDTPLKYEPPEACIWSAEELNSIEAKMCSQDIGNGGGAVINDYKEGSSYSPIQIELGKTHTGKSRVCWLKFDTEGAYDIDCEANNATIYLYNSFRNAPLDPIGIVQNSLKETINDTASVLRFVCISSNSESKISHSLNVKTHLDTQAFDTNYAGAYWIPENVSEDSTAFCDRVIYLKGETVSGIKYLIEQNDTYSNVRNFYDFVDTLAPELMKMGAAEANGLLFLAAFGIALVSALSKPASSQEVIDAILNNSSQYSKGLRFEERLSIASNNSICESWDSKSNLTGISGHVGTWHYYTEEDFE